MNVDHQRARARVPSDSTAALEHTDEFSAHQFSAPSPSRPFTYDCTSCRRSSVVARPSLSLKQYAGSYADPWYGNIAVNEENGDLTLRFARTPAMIADLAHWHHNTFRALFRDKTVPDAFVTFGLDHHGRIDQVSMEAVSSLADFSFDYQDLLFRPVRP